MIVKYFFSKRFKNFLELFIDSTDFFCIEDLILSEGELIEDFCFQFTLIDFGTKENTISFISINNLEKLYKESNVNCDINEWILQSDDSLWLKYRSELKVGRFIKKFIPDVSDREVQEFEHFYKAHHASFRYEMVIVSGEDIIKYYNKDFQDLECGKSTLSDSCMSYTTKSQIVKQQQGKILESEQLQFYALNSNIELLILRYKGSDKIKGRALLWTLTNGKKYVDCPYVDFEFDKKLFIKYANDNKHIMYVDESKLPDILPFMEVKSNQKIRELFCFSEKDTKYSIPKLDTFGFNIFSNTITR